MMMEGEEEPHRDPRGDDAETVALELQPKRTTSYKARFKNNKKPAPPAGTDLVARIAREREKTKYWARLLLLFPLCPVIVALSTIVFGGVVINVANNKCNSMLMQFLQGAVVLSHVLVLFYTYCWMGPRPIKRLRTLRIFYVVYGFVCFIWWGIFGTLQAVTATSSGFESCLSTSPALYLMAQYEVAVFWILFLLFVGFVVMEKTAAARQAKLDVIHENKLNALRVKRLAEKEAREEALKAEQAEARRQQEAEKRKLEDEQDRLFRDSDTDDGENGNNQRDNDVLGDDGEDENLDDLLMEPGDNGDDREGDEEVKKAV